MKISNIKILVNCPGRNFVTVKVETEEGVYGLGDATVNGREMAVVAYLEEHVKPCLLGKDAHQIEDIWPHGAPDLSPICHAAQAHLNIWANNFGIQEFIGFGGTKLNEVFKHPLSLKDGYVLLADKPGLGVDFNEEAAKKYKYKRSYLPVTRLEDGTLWNW